MSSLYEAITGKTWPKDVAYMVSNGRNGLERVTWAQLKAERIKRQRERLAHITAIDAADRQAAYVWAFYVPGIIYGGWHLYLRTIRESFWISRDFRGQRWGLYNDLTMSIMECLPCGFLPMADKFDDWLKTFAATYPRPKRRGGKVQGVVYGWAKMNGDRPVAFVPVERTL